MSSSEKIIGHANPHTVKKFELIEKYAGKFAMDDTDYDYCVYIGNTPVTHVYSYEKFGDRLKDYYRQCYHNQDSGMKSEKSMCQKAS